MGGALEEEEVFEEGVWCGSSLGRRREGREEDLGGKEELLEESPPPEVLWVRPWQVGF